jgi:ferrochelatase
MNPRTGLLLINLGTPDSPQPQDVRRYLKQFLSDPRVVDLPAVFRWLLLHGVILPLRSRSSSELYQKIWQPEGSPLLINSDALLQGLATKMGESYAIALGMRYGSPSIAEGIEELLQQGVQRLILLPLFPQYSSAATGSVMEEALRILAGKNNIPEIHIINEFHAHPAYIKALCSMIVPALAEFKPDFTLLSYHGLPERQVRRSGGCDRVACDLKDPCPAISTSNQFCYRAQCYATSRLLAQELNLPAHAYGVAFQSRLGRIPWIKPYTDEYLTTLAEQGIKRLTLISPGFVADCLETLEELNIRAREQWHRLGGEALQVIPCLNAAPAWVAAIEEIISL